MPEKKRRKDLKFLAKRYFALPIKIRPKDGKGWPVALVVSAIIGPQFGQEIEKQVQKMLEENITRGIGFWKIERGNNDDWGVGAIERSGRVHTTI